jgi:integrase
MAINIRCPVCKSDVKLSAKKCPKCGESFSNMRHKTYKVIVRDGSRRISRHVSSLELARKIEAKFKLEIERGEHGFMERKQYTLDDVWKKYLPIAKQEKPKSWITDDHNYRTHISPAFGKKLLSRISAFDIERFLSDMRSGNNPKGRKYAPQTVKHQIVLISHLYRLAEKWGMYSGKNPTKTVRQIKINNKQTEFLSDDELSRLMKVLNTWPERMAASIVKFAITTGMRRGEIFKLTWEDIDEKHGMIRIKDPKGGHDQHLPLSDVALSVIDEVPRAFDTPYIFYGMGGRKRTYIKGSWNEIKKAANIPQTFRFHGLRHHFASTLVSSGVDLYIVQKLLAHRDAATTQRYAHLANQTLRDAVEVSDRTIERALQNIEQENKTIAFRG